MISRLRGLDWAKAARVLWAATLLALPVTSFRYFPAGEGTYVRPLSFFPLSVLLLILLIRALRHEMPFLRSGALTPLAAFLLIVLTTSMLGILLAPVPVRGQDVVGRIARAWVTVLMGVGFFVAAICMNRREEELRFSVRWLLAGLVITFLWSGLQAATFYLNALPKVLVTQWQRAFSLRELIRTNRISGMAYEPSWLAGQVSTVYLPWLLAAVLSRIRVTRFRWLEPGMLVLAVALVAATFSRGGILIAGLSIGATLALAGGSEIRKGLYWFASGFTRVQDWALRLGVSVIAIALIAGGLLFLGQKGYVARIWNTQASNMADFLIMNSAGARAAYFSSALKTYKDYPWTGVGLGASGLYMHARLPDWSLTTVPEIARQLSPQSSLYPNPKNLYVRLLAETGLLGLILYLAFQFSLLGDALGALRRASTIWRYVGIAALCSWIALALYNMTQDSFATPNLWINLGILAGISAPNTQAASRG
jgi:O-antigen ligase